MQTAPEHPGGAPVVTMDMSISSDLRVIRERYSELADALNEQSISSELRNLSLEVSDSRGGSGGPADSARLYEATCEDANED
jgi:hypothetical protein